MNPLDASRGDFLRNISYFCEGGGFPSVCCASRLERHYCSSLTNWQCGLSLTYCFYCTLQVILMKS